MEMWEREAHGKNEQELDLKGPLSAGLRTLDFILKGVGSHGMGEQCLRRGWDTGGGLPIV